QTRRQEVYLAKLSYDLSNTANLSLTALYTPTSSQYFAPDYKNSDYTIDTKNYSFVVQAENQLSNSQVELTLGYTGQKTVRNAHENRFAWSAETASIDWPNTRLGVEGGRGLLNTGQEQLGIKSAISFNSMHWGQTNHRLKFGGEATYSNQYYHRPKTNYHYYSPDAATLNTPIVCAQNDPACIDNEQYLLKRTKYLQADTDVEITDFAVFIQDSIIWKRLEIAPGVRISYDDFSGNLNIASRFAASLDVFGNQSTTLFAGKNRYYSGTLLTHALYKDIAVIRQAREDQNSDWEDIDNRPMTFRYANGEIKTPYSDELTLGLIQKVFGGKLKIQYIEKTNKDELARSKISDPERIEPDIYLFNNFGRSEHKSIQLSWQRSWQNHFLEINSTWQETTTSHDDYFETLDADDIAETIWYDGDELHYYEIPKTDFNRPIIANLVYICKLPYNVTFTNRTKFRGAYWKLKNTRAKQQSIVHPDQESYIFEKKKSHSSFLFDWRLSWKTPRFFKQNTTLSLDIYNVLNHKTNLDYQSGDYGYDYELGRQFWAGVEFKF
ncbi:MAG: TonB-dependent receptor, partial [Thermodesulfobacteriota bacterium]|nr:TonB-dependent receptor [Thermodesulfobacteriota bacterium]